jgi:TldD protein
LPLGFALALSLAAGAQQQAKAAAAPIDAMTAELHRAFTSLGKQGDDEAVAALLPQLRGERRQRCDRFSAQYGALVNSGTSPCAWPMCRCESASPKLDNTHGAHRSSAVNSATLPLTDDREALARTLWLATNAGYGTALENYLRVKTEAEVARQGRGHLAGLQPGGAAGPSWQAPRRR